jgi:hypothetical protein
MAASIKTMSTCHGRLTNAALLTALCGSALFGCARPDAGPTVQNAAKEAARSLTRADPATLELLEAAGDQATVVVLLRPDQWRGSLDALKTLFPGLKDKVPRRLGLALDAPDLLEAVATLLHGGSMGSLPKEVGLDPSRPMVLALYEPTSIDLAGVLEVMMSHQPRRGIPGPRHRALLPVKDPAAAKAALVRLFKKRRLQLHPSHDPARDVSVLRSRDGDQLALIPGRPAGYLQLVWAQRPELIGNQPPAVGAVSPGLLEPPKKTLTRTPALEHTASVKGLAALYVRSWELRRLARQMSVRRIISAVRGIHPSQIGAMSLLGVSETFEGQRLMASEGAEADDLSVSLSVALGGLGLNMVQSLTDRGVRIYQAGLKQAHRPLQVTTKRSLLKGWLALAPEAMLDRAAPPGPSHAPVDPGQQSTLIKKCGYHCSLHGLLRQPLGYAKVVKLLLQQKGAGALAGHLPRSFTFVLQDLDLSTGRPRLAAGFTVPPGLDVDLTQRLVDEALNKGSRGRPRATLELQRGKQHDRLLLGLGIQPRGVIQSRPISVPAGVLGEIELDTRMLPDAPWRGGRQLVEALRRVDVVKLRLELQSRALISRLLLYKGDAAPPPVDLPRAPHADHDPVTVTPGRRCLDDLTHLFVRILSDMSQHWQYDTRADAAARERRLTRGVRAFADRLPCALKDPAAAATGKRLRRALTLLRSRYLESLWRPEERDRLLAEACAEKSKESPDACKLRQQLRDLPEVELARHDVTCLDHLTPDLLGVRGSVIAVVAASGAVKKVKQTSTIGDNEPLLLVADRRATFGAAVRATRGHTIPFVQVLVAAANKLTDAYYAWLPRPDLLTRPTDKPLIVLEVAGKTVRLRGPKRLRTRLARKGCTRGGQDLGAILKCIDQQLSNPDPLYVLMARPKTPWGRVAPVLARVAGCEKGWRRRVHLLPARRGLKPPGVVLTAKIK